MQMGRALTPTSTPGGDGVVASVPVATPAPAPMPSFGLAPRAPNPYPAYYEANYPIPVAGQAVPLLYNDLNAFEYQYYLNPPLGTQWRQVYDAWVANGGGTNWFAVPSLGLAGVEPRIYSTFTNQNGNFVIGNVTSSNPQYNISQGYQPSGPSIMTCVSDGNFIWGPNIMTAQHVMSDGSLFKTPVIDDNPWTGWIQFVAVAATIISAGAAASALSASGTATTETAVDTGLDATATLPDAPSITSALTPADVAPDLPAITIPDAVPVATLPEAPTVATAVSGTLSPADQAELNAINAMGSGPPSSLADTSDLLPSADDFPVTPPPAPTPEIVPLPDADAAALAQFASPFGDLTPSAGQVVSGATAIGKALGAGGSGSSAIGSAIAAGAAAASGAVPNGSIASDTGASGTTSSGSIGVLLAAVLGAYLLTRGKKQ